jgi:hypothetical protein
MPLHLRLATAVILCCVGSIAQAQTEPQPKLPNYAVLYDCASWTGARQAKAGISQESWLMGFLAAQAIDEFFRSKRDILSQHDFRALLSWVDNYCQSKPLDNLLDAAIALTTELSKRALNRPANK